MPVSDGRLFTRYFQSLKCSTDALARTVSSELRDVLMSGGRPIAELHAAGLRWSDDVIRFEMQQLSATSGS
jgi:hypothetical protein